MCFTDHIIKMLHAVGSVEGTTLPSEELWVIYRFLVLDRNENIYKDYDADHFYSKVQVYSDL